MIITHNENKLMLSSFISSPSGQRFEAVSSCLQDYFSRYSNAASLDQGEPAILNLNWRLKQNHEDGVPLSEKLIINLMGELLSAAESHYPKEFTREHDIEVSLILLSLLSDRCVMPTTSLNLFSPHSHPSFFSPEGNFNILTINSILQLPFLRKRLQHQGEAATSHLIYTAAQALKGSSILEGRLFTTFIVPIMQDMSQLLPHIIRAFPQEMAQRSCFTLINTALESVDRKPEIIDALVDAAFSFLNDCGVLPRLDNIQAQEQHSTILSILSIGGVLDKICERNPGTFEANVQEATHYRSKYFIHLLSMHFSSQAFDGRSIVSPETLSWLLTIPAFNPVYFINAEELSDIEYNHTSVFFTVVFQSINGIEMVRQCFALMDNITEDENKPYCTLFLALVSMQNIPEDWLSVIQSDLFGHPHFSLELYGPYMSGAIFEELEEMHGPALFSGM